MTLLTEDEFRAATLDSHPIPPLNEGNRSLSCHTREIQKIVHINSHVKNHLITRGLMSPSRAGSAAVRPVVFMSS